MKLTEREERALRLLRDVQTCDIDINAIMKGEKEPKDLGFKTNISKKAFDILDIKRSNALQELRKLLDKEDDEEDEDTIYLEKTRTKGLTRSI